eukprot:SAG22_NODE_4984_length_1115_cov_1.589567_2_plen_117_part_01
MLLASDPAANRITVPVGKSATAEQLCQAATKALRSSKPVRRLYTLGGEHVQLRHISGLQAGEVWIAAVTTAKTLSKKTLAAAAAAHSKARLVSVGDAPRSTLDMERSTKGMPPPLRR